MKKSRVVVFTAPHELEIREVDIPDIKEGQALIRIKACNICTTEQGQYSGKRPLKYPVIGGHEFGGVIEEIKDNTNSGLAVGDRVAIGYDYCGECSFCKKGLFNFCEGLPEEDIRYGGYRGMFGLADYIAAPIKAIYKFSDELPFNVIGFEEPLGTVVHGQQKVNITPGDFVVIFGAGTMGILNALYAKVQGANVAIIDMQGDRLEVAKNAGIPHTINPSKEDVAEAVNKLTGGAGADCVILAVGNTNANNQAQEIVRYGGKILFFAAGYPKPSISLDSNDIHYSEVQLIGTSGGNPNDFSIANKLINNKIIDVTALLDEEFPVQRAKEAFEKSIDGKSYRVTINF